MADDVLTRNSADELALRVVQSSGDTGANKDDVYTRDSQGRLAVRTVGGSGGGSVGASTAADVSFDPSGLDVITETNVQSALAQVDSSVKDLQDSVSVLTTSAELSTEIGGKTTVALGDLTAMDIDGRPSYKQAGATVYADNGVVGIIDSVDSTSAIITTVSYQAGEVPTVPIEIKWDKEQSFTVEPGYAWERTYAACSLNFGALADGKYYFYMATRKFTQSCYTQQGDPIYTYDSMTEFSTMKIEFEILNGDTVWGRCFIVSPICGFVEGVNVFGGESAVPTGVPSINKVNGEFHFIVEQPDLFMSDCPMYIDTSGDFVLWKVTKLFDGSGTESEIVIYNVGYQNSREPENVGVRLSYLPLVRFNLSTLQFPTSLYWGQLYNPKTPVQALFITPTINPNYDISNDPHMSGVSYGTYRVCLVKMSTGDSCVLEVSIVTNYVYAKVVRANGVFENLNWHIGQDAETSVFAIADSFIWADGFVFDGVAMNASLCGYNGDGGWAVSVTGWDVLPEMAWQMPFMKSATPTASTSAYAIGHDNGLLEMGDVVAISETMQPGVAFGNIPVVFPQELANANFVPTVTVITDGSFKQVMADVANLATTGFDLCVRNIDTEAVSGIKIAWKVVGLKK